VQPLSFSRAMTCPSMSRSCSTRAAACRPICRSLQSAASGLVGTLRGSDRGPIVDGQGFIGIPRPFTGDRGTILNDLFARLKTSGSTAPTTGCMSCSKSSSASVTRTLQVRRQALVLLSVRVRHHEPSRVRRRDGSRAAGWREHLRHRTAEQRRVGAARPRRFDHEGELFDESHRARIWRPFVLPQVRARPPCYLHGDRRGAGPTSTSWDMCPGAVATAPSDASMVRVPPQTHWARANAKRDTTRRAQGRGCKETLRRLDETQSMCRTSPRQRRTIRRRRWSTAPAA